MAYWLLKSEPDTYSWDDLCRESSGVGRWDGVRNYQARLHLRGMKKGDLALFYHSVIKPTAIAGVMEIVNEAYTDPVQFDKDSPYYDAKSTPEKPRWDCVEVRPKYPFNPFISSDELKAKEGLKGMVLFQNSRLSVQPVTPAEWKIIHGLRKVKLAKVRE
ncbi:MAG: hypothetical protein AMXMBFR84_42220 [Candidatus Hydrogenedentota bacterium]